MGWAWILWKEAESPAPPEWETQFKQINYLDLLVNAFFKRKKKSDFQSNFKETRIGKFLNKALILLLILKKDTSVKFF